MIDIKDESIELHHWPENALGDYTGHPYYLEPQVDDDVLTETRKLWPLLEVVEAPRPFDAARQGVFRLSGAESPRLHSLAVQHALT